MLQGIFLNHYKLALIGKDISHSQSPVLFKELLKDELSRYDLIDITEASDIDISELLNDYDALFVTAPYKKSFLQYIDEFVNYKAAVNVIYQQGKAVKALNSDLLGIKSNFKQLKKEMNFNRVIILGDGAMSKCFQSFLPDAHVLSRRNGKISDLVSFISKGDLIINCCSRDFDLSALYHRDFSLWDMNYKTNVKQSGFSFYEDGFSLLKLQAELSFPFWKRDEK